MSASEIISLIGLIVGMQALLMVFYLKAIEKVSEQRDKSIQEILKNKYLIDKNHEVFIGALSELTSTQRLFGALLVRLNNNSEIKRPELISKEIGKYDFQLQKCMHEVNIFHTNPTYRQSAIRALAEDYGDLESLSLMEGSLHKLNGGDDPDLINGIIILRRRINSRIQ